jgi:hypothetical protein
MRYHSTSTGLRKFHTSSGNMSRHVWIGEMPLAGVEAHIFHDLCPINTETLHMQTQAFLRALPFTTNVGDYYAEVLDLKTTDWLYLKLSGGI